MTSGGTEILNFGITPISLTDLAAVGKVSDGDWITVRFDRLVLRPPQPAHYALVVVSERMLGKVKTCEIRSEIYGASDHCPIVLEIDDTFGGTDGAEITDTVGTTNTIETAGSSATS